MIHHHSGRFIRLSHIQSINNLCHHFYTLSNRLVEFIVESGVEIDVETDQIDETLDQNKHKQLVNAIIVHMMNVNCSLLHSS